MTNKISLFILASLLIINSNFETLNAKTLTIQDEIVKKEIKFSAFTNIDLKGHSEVELIKGDAFKAVISDYPNQIDNIKLEVVGSTLEIRFENNKNSRNNKSKSKVVIYVPNEAIKALAVSGSGNISIQSDFSNLSKFQISGSGKIISEVPITVTKLSTSISGCGDLELSKIKSNTAVCSISGSGSAHLNVVEKLNVSISGSGKVKYMGDPMVSKSIAGSGGVSKM